MATRFCIYCGAKHNEGDLFCYNCGKPVFDMDKFMKENGLISEVPEEAPVKEEPVEIIPPQPKVEEVKPVEEEKPVEEVQKPEETPVEEPVQEEAPQEEQPKVEEPKQEESVPEEEDRRLGFDGGKIVGIIFTLISMLGLIVSFGMRFSENTLPYFIYVGGALFALIGFIFSIVRKQFRRDPVSRHFYSTFAVLNIFMLLAFLGVSAFIVPNLIKNVFPMF